MTLKFKWRSSSSTFLYLLVKNSFKKTTPKAKIPPSKALITIFKVLLGELGDVGNKATSWIFNLFCKKSYGSVSSLAISIAFSTRVLAICCANSGDSLTTEIWNIRTWAVVEIDIEFLIEAIETFANSGISSLTLCTYDESSQWTRIQQNQKHYIFFHFQTNQGFRKLDMSAWWYWKNFSNSLN